MALLRNEQRRKVSQSRRILVQTSTTRFWITTPWLQICNATLPAKSARRELQEYWHIFEQLRTELGYADYLGGLQRYRTKHPHAQQLLCLSDFLINYPFAERLFPDALKVIERVEQWGPAVILSDGDVVFQPLKIRRSGLASSVSGDVLIYVHKEQELDDVERRYPAEHYVLVDDKLRILTAVEKFLGPACDHYFR